MEIVARILKVLLQNVNPGTCSFGAHLKKAAEAIQMVVADIIKIIEIVSPPLEMLSVEKFSVKGEQIDL